MGQNNHSEQFQNILRTGNAQKLQAYVNSNKAELQNWMGQQQGAWSKLPNYQDANSAWTNFHRGSGSAADFSNLQRFFKVTPQQSQGREQSERPQNGDKNRDRSSGAPEQRAEQRSPNNQKNKNEKCGNEKCEGEDSCKKISYDKNQKNKKDAA